MNALTNSGGVNALPPRYANLCPSGVEQNINGDCDAAIGSLPVTYRLAPGARGVFSPGPSAVKPFAFWIPSAHCTAGYAPFIGGYQFSCRPVTQLPGAGCARNAPYPGNKNYSYTY